ncbi:hypothetical protein [Comamonas jiangduensis]|uniref:hypothetical protein n=1 Tax=Comamonas jiangduensis TaxID=1194168 RepID=UPI003BF8A396
MRDYTHTGAWIYTDTRPEYHDENTGLDILDAPDFLPMGFHHHRADMDALEQTRRGSPAHNIRPGAYRGTAKD